MWKLLFASVTAFVMAGCATSPVPASQAAKVPKERVVAFQETPAAPFGKVTVTRDSGFVGGGCLLGFYVDGALAAKFETSESASFLLPAKEYIFGIGVPEGRGLCSLHDGERRELESRVSNGDSKYFRLVYRPGDGPVLEATTQR